MAFSSAAFVFVFLPIVFLLHTLIKNQRARNVILIIASLLFYSAGALAHLPLLIAVVLVNYLAGLLFLRGTKHKRAVLAVAVILNIGALAVFKYLDFFTGSLNEAFGLSIPLAKLALPIGISFFIFQGLSYTIDVYRDASVGTRSFWELLLYISFFPQLIAGPIVKYTDVRTQIERRETIPADMAAGCRRLIVGLSKKLLIADILAGTVDTFFASGISDARLSAVAAVFYTLQIYFDFSGYSDMAIGMGRMFGFHFLENFDFPYIAGSVRQFWKRWHISLTSWFRTYLYIPLGGNRKGQLRTCLNVLLIFFLTGLWHGAGWTFILWGLWHGLWSVLERVTPLKKAEGTVFGHIYTLLVVILGFVLFRADSLSQAWTVLGGLFTGWSFPHEGTLLLRQCLDAKVLTAAVFGIVLSTGVQRKLFAWMQTHRPLEVTAYAGALLLFVLCILRLSSASFNPFIYFRF